MLETRTANKLGKAPSQKQEVAGQRNEELQVAAAMSPEERAKLERRLLWKRDARFVL